MSLSDEFILSLIRRSFRSSILNPGTGNVLKIQNLLHICSEHFEADKAKDEKESKDKKHEKKEDKKSETTEADGSHQGIATLGLAAIAMGEDIGMEMSLRSFNHLVSFLAVETAEKGFYQEQRGVF